MASRNQSLWRGRSLACAFVREVVLMPWLVVLQDGVDGELSPLMSRLAGPNSDWPLACTTCDDHGAIADLEPALALLSKVGFAQEVDVLVVTSDVGCAGRALNTAGQVFRDLLHCRYWVIACPAESPNQDQIDTLMRETRDINLKGILFPARSTSAKALLSAADRRGITVDVTWALTAGGLSQHPNAIEDRALWAVSTESFTSLANENWQYSPPVVKAVLDVLAGDNGPLKPADAKTLDHYTELGKQWVRERHIGADPEWRELVASSHGDLFRLLELRQEGSLFQPEAWAAAIDRAYLEAAGAPLAEFKREVRSNAHQLLHGRGDKADLEGHLPVLQSRLDALLQEESGLIACSRFINGAASELARSAGDVAGRSVTPGDPDPDTARRDLVAAVAELPAARPWLVRSLVLGTAGVALAPLLPGVAAATLAVLVVTGSGLLLGRARNHAQAARAAYVASVQARLRGLGEEYALGQWKALIDELARNLGAFRDASGVVADMEHAVAPPENTRAGQLFLLWSRMRELLEQASSPPVPELLNAGDFATQFPLNCDDVSSLDQPDLPPVVAAVEQTEQFLRELLVGMRLGAHVESFCDQLRAAPVAPDWPLGTLLAEIPTARERADEQLHRENSPWRTAMSPSPTRMWCAPAGVREAITSSRYPEGDLESQASDPARAVRAWFHRVQDANQVLEPLPVIPADPQPPPAKPGPRTRRVGA